MTTLRGMVGPLVKATPNRRFSLSACGGSQYD
jgi:hypothetical protein